MRDVTNDPFFAAVCRLLKEPMVPIFELLWTNGRASLKDFFRLKMKAGAAMGTMMSRYVQMKETVRRSPYGRHLQFTETCQHRDDYGLPCLGHGERIWLTILSVPEEFARPDPSADSINSP